ncbi:hypothetical protein MEQU1_001749 [Malassezia equina]|uniref:Ribosomal RNA-processing protein 14 n=1 Tax=Malassezia equina TaxID=1381935 RepID=A0AAF0J3K1_9BASI|nr:hypothetical protein MEQU1_001749 [Malassezia equina]
MAAAMEKPSSRGLYKSSLEAHTEAFETLLGLIPAQFYVPPNDDQEIDAKYQKNKRTKSQKQQEAEERKLRAKEAKRAKSVDDVQAERRVDMDVDFDDAGDEEDDGNEDEENEAGEEESTPETPASALRRASIAELRERLHTKIQMLHQQRHPHEASAPGTPSTKEELLEERRRQRGEMRDRRRRERKEARRQAKAQAGKSGAAERVGPTLGSTRTAGALVDAQAASVTHNAPPPVMEGDLSFSQVSFETTHAPDPQRKNKYALPSDPKSALSALEARQRREEAKIQKRVESGQDAAQVREAMQESERWGKALAAAEGIKIRDNVNALKQTIKRRERAKEKSTKAWQKRRMENLAARREAKKTGTKPKKSAKPGKARPGFEGSARSLHGATVTTAAPSSDAAVPTFQNPYEGHRALSSSEQELLGEYARLAATVRRLSNSTHHDNTLRELRAIERKMGLVLTLFKASVWAIVMQQTDMEEAELDEQMGAPFEPLMETSEEAWEDSHMAASSVGEA